MAFANPVETFEQVFVDLKVLLPIVILSLSIMFNGNPVSMSEKVETNKLYCLGLPKS